MSILEPLHKVGLGKRLILGDFPNANFVLIGPAGVGKTTYVRQGLYQRLSMGYKCVYVCIDYHPLNAISYMKTFGWDVTPFIDNGQLFLVDCYSWKLHDKRQIDEKYKDKIFQIDPKNLIELNIFLEKIRREKGYGWIAFDSLTGLILYTGYEQATKFLDVLTSRIKEQGIGVFTLSSGILKDYPERMESTFDGLIEFKYEESSEGLQSYVRMKKFGLAPIDKRWHKFTITSRGIEMEP